MKPIARSQTVIELLWAGAGGAAEVTSPEKTVCRHYRVQTPSRRQAEPAAGRGGGGGGEVAAARRWTVDGAEGRGGSGRAAWWLAGRVDQGGVGAR